MGNRQNSSQQIEPSEKDQTKIRTSFQVWQDSQKTTEDIYILLTTTKFIKRCTSLIDDFLKSLTNRQKYQNSLIIILQYFQGQVSIDKDTLREREQLYTYYINKLKDSYFMKERFHQSSPRIKIKPYEKLYFLYQSYVNNKDFLQKAIAFNYPNIFLEFKQFIKEIISEQIIVRNQQHLFNFIISFDKLEEIKNICQNNCKLYEFQQRSSILDEIKQVQDLKQIYLDGLDQFLSYDYADLTSKFCKNMQLKGYIFNELQEEKFLKIQIYSLLLYNFAKLTMTFQQINQMTITEILHYFFTNYNIEETADLIKCFNIFSNSSEKWYFYIFNYLFSPLSHISFLIRLIENKYILLKYTQSQFNHLLQKIKLSSCQIGKYETYLVSFIDKYPIDQIEKERYIKLTKLIYIFNVFNINEDVQNMYNLINIDLKENSANFKEKILKIIQLLITNYFKLFQIKTKTIQVLDQIFAFSTIFGILQFCMFLNQKFFHGLLSNHILHQIFIKELLTQEKYIEIKALLSQQKIQYYGIDFETVEMLIIDNLINFLSTKKISKNKDNINLLFNILSININGYHYLTYYYKYFKYLEDSNISLSYQHKNTFNISTLYQISDQYINQIEHIDFNYLFTLSSAIKAQHTDSNLEFIPIVTDQFLKFKIYISNKAYKLKKNRLGNQILQQIIKYQPPWISTQLIKILKDQKIHEDFFLKIAFDYCVRGEDLQYIISLYRQRGQKEKSKKISLKNLKKMTLFQQDKYLILADDIILDENQYKNLVAEMTFNEETNIKELHFLFFHLFTVEIERAFNYALNNKIPLSFIINFVQEGIKKNILNNNIIVKHLLKFLYCSINLQNSKQGYIKFKEYVNIKMQTVLQYKASQSSKNKANYYPLEQFNKLRQNYCVQQIVTEEFIQLYIQNNNRNKFLFEQTFRKHSLVELREQPMTKANAKILKSLTDKAGLDIIEISLYNLISRVNTSEQMDDYCWNIVQKLIFWSEDKQNSSYIVKKLRQKIQIIEIFASIAEYLRQSQPIYKQIISEYHLEILKSLAAIEEEKNLYGILQQDFFVRKIGVYLNKISKTKRILSQNHQRIIENVGCIENIFVLSKALYFMYGCNDEVQRIILGQFSLKQDDSEEFQLLRKKIKGQHVT